MTEPNAGRRMTRPTDLRAWMVRLACASLISAGLSAMTDVTPAAADEHTSRAASEDFTRIVGGTEARKGAWPWQVALVLSGGEGDERAGQRSAAAR